MTNRQSPSDVFASEPTSVCLVRWVLRTGRAAIACEVEMTPDRSFAVRVVPSWQPGATRVQHFASAMPAIKQHAQVAGALRELGWAVTDRTTALPSA